MSEVMTIGTLARRTGVPVKTLRAYEDMGLIYTVGRSTGNYRLFGDEALWCVGVVSGLRGLGLTLQEIRDLAGTYLQDTGEPVGPRLAAVLQAVRARTQQRIAELQQRLAPPSWPGMPTSAPRTRARGEAGLTFPPGGDHNLIE
jgi:MerR family transcriptional regulator, copper efflux regulator